MLKDDNQSPQYPDFSSHMTGMNTPMTQMASNVVEYSAQVPENQMTENSGLNSADQSLPQFPDEIPSIIFAHWPGQNAGE